MTVELRPMGVACNLGCTYCYQEPMRKAGNISVKYDVDKMLEQAEATGQDFNLFGGEALLVPKRDLERFWKRGFELQGNNGIQTNGTLIDDEHIALFQKYNVNVGVSIDGPNELNSLRPLRGKVGNDEVTLEKSTKKTIDNISKLQRAGISVSIIITLHRENGSKERLPRLLNFIKWLGDIGVRYGNIHTLEVDATMPDQEIHVLSQEENIYAFKEIASFLDDNPHLSYNPFSDYKDIMRNDDRRTNCTWNFCDSMNTQAVYGIEGNGGLSNCGRTNKEGVDFYKADGHGYERYFSLYNSPDEFGGCQGCPFFVACSGSCPGEASDNDFRNKTIHCHTQRALLGHYEQLAIKDGIVPFSKRNDLKDIEALVLNSLEQGQPMKIYDAIRNIDDNKMINVRSVQVR